MSTGTFFWAFSLLACSAVAVFAQEPSEKPKPVAPTFQAPVVASNPQASKEVLGAASSPRIVAYCGYDCTGFVSSSGNLYFTGHTNDNAGMQFGRTGKDSTPGNENLLYNEAIGAGNRLNYFGSVVWAKPDDYYGYFAANYEDFDSGVYKSQVKRVPLAGGAAVILGNSPGYIGMRDLVTDGSTLFWTDDGGIRSMSVSGGTIRTLVTSTSVFNISLDGTYVYYAVDTHISRVPKVGGNLPLCSTLPMWLPRFTRSSVTPLTRPARCVQHSPELPICMPGSAGPTSFGAKEAELSEAAIPWALTDIRGRLRSTIPRVES